MRVQRLRVTFGRGPEIKYITHLDLMRFWERSFRRAGLPLAYSEGFSPHPQISLAAPLPVGVTSTAELMDIFLTERLEPDQAKQMMQQQLAPGLGIDNVSEVGLNLPSIQSQIRAAEYRIELPDEVDVAQLEARVRGLMTRDSVPWQHQREREIRSYDLRPLVWDLSVVLSEGRAWLTMRLQADNSATGRPEQVSAALELPQRLPIERTRLILADGESVSENQSGHVVAGNAERPNG